MPLVRFKNKTFRLRWLKEWDVKLLVAAVKFRKYNSVDWIKAEMEGYLKGLPNVSRNDLSRRLSYLLQVRYDPIKYKKRRDYYKDYDFKRNKSFQNKLLVFKEIPETYKYGYRSKRKWNKKSLNILLKLVRKYRDKKFIRWNKLMKDDLVKYFPQDCNITRLRSFYWRYISSFRTEIVKKRRKEALKYKYKNYERYKRNQNRNMNIIRKSVNDFLRSKIEIR